MYLKDGMIHPFVASSSREREIGVERVGARINAETRDSVAT